MSEENKMLKVILALQHISRMLPSQSHVLSAPSCLLLDY